MTTGVCLTAKEINPQDQLLARRIVFPVRRGHTLIVASQLPPGNAPLGAGIPPLGVVARRLGISVKELTKLIHEGKLPHPPTRSIPAINGGTRRTINLYTASWHADAARALAALHGTQPGKVRRLVSTGHARAAKVNSTAFVSLVKVSGTSGVLTAVGVASGANYHYFRITIDGAIVETGIVTGSNASVVAANNGLGVALPFTDSFDVEVRDSPNPSALTTYWAAWTTTHTKPIEGPIIHAEKVDGQEFIRELTTFGDGDVRYDVDALIGPRRWSQVELGTDYYFAEEDLTGTVRVWEDGGDRARPVYLESVSLVVRPAGLTRTLGTLQVEQVDGRKEFAYSSADLPIHQDRFEILADLDGYANIPATFYRR